MRSSLSLVLNELCSTKRVRYEEFVSDSSAVVPLAAALTAANWNHEKDSSRTDQSAAAGSSFQLAKSTWKESGSSKRRRDEEGTEDPSKSAARFRYEEGDLVRAAKTRARDPPPICHIEDATFREHFGMGKTLLEKLFRQIHIKIFSIEDTRRGKGFFIPSAKKVLLTVWLLCTQESFREVADRFGVSKGGVHVTFINTCKLLIRCSEDFVRWPDYDDQLATATILESKYGFPGVVGVVGECVINNSIKSGSKVSSAVAILQGVCDASQRFFDVFVSDPMERPASRVFKQTPLFSRLHGGLSTSGDYHLLGDSSYPLMINLLVPFRDDGVLTSEQSEYNRIHEATYAIIGKTFARLKGRFRRLDSLYMSRGDLVTTVVRAICCLHNYIVRHEDVDTTNYEPLYDELQYPACESDVHCLQAAEKADLIANLMSSRVRRDEQ